MREIVVMKIFILVNNIAKDCFGELHLSIKDLSPMAETPRHGDIVADTEKVLQTVFVYINVNSFCFH